MAIGARFGPDSADSAGVGHDDLSHCAPALDEAVSCPYLRSIARRERLGRSATDSSTVDELSDGGKDVVLGDEIVAVPGTGEHELPMP